MIPYLFVLHVLLDIHLVQHIKNVFLFNFVLTNFVFLVNKDTIHLKIIVFLQIVYNLIMIQLVFNVSSHIF